MEAGGIEVCVEINEDVECAEGQRDWVDYFHYGGPWG